MSQGRNASKKVGNYCIISSADYNWLRQGPKDQPGGNLSASLFGPEGSEKFFQGFQVS